MYLPALSQSLLVLALALLIPLWPTSTLPLLNILKSFTSKPTMAGISETQKAQLQEVADLMLEIYQTLARMRYLDPRGIQIGPHNITELRPLYEQHGLDPSIIYLYSILPYVDTAAAGNEDFYNGGEFTDFRTEDDVEQGRDPFYAGPTDEDFDDEDGPYIRPWVTPLSRLGNHQSVIVYDARKHRIWIIDQEGWCSTDPALEDVEEETPKSKNRSNFDHIPSRPAGDVLRDIIRWYRELKELPGGGEHSGGEWDHEDLDLKGLYRKHGWPDNFDGDAFQVDKARAYCADRVKYGAEEPLRAVERFKNWKEWSGNTIQDRRKAIAAAKSPDEEWVTRLELWDAERSYRRHTEELKKAEQEASRLCPDGVCLKLEDIPLLELDSVRQEYEYKQREAEDERKWMEETPESNPEDAERFQNSFYLAEKEAAIYRKAWEAAKADAERLCPGRTLNVTGPETSEQERTMAEVQRMEDHAMSVQLELAALREWASQIPDDATTAKDKANSKIQTYQQWWDDGQARIATLKATL
ncbi:hypothetical protein BO94DRAFT_531577 [Aspergillus sclerotioniger CBS 115572]|uniref:Uncharacterized protein n=1 Tax=Aspergillus sclerotioniger CBS 115572 TaxID=1450535 RepID=A0A317X8M2_9EURO|nr:hypothetical protein BO94DRAFT_531577 [Aspergillus sclerotioniger CBS 115572]PWY94635.1 hypothetical protein BO94DRAFT_531577 [Aspergillus sclerotioniger CBS 115572]